MTRFKKLIVMPFFAAIVVCSPAIAQERPWSLNDCISYALEKNISVQKAGLTTNKNELYLQQAKASRLPSLSASVSQNFSWSKDYNSTTGKYGSFSGADNQSASLNSSVSLYNGNRINNQIEQSQLSLKSSVYNELTIKEQISVNVLDAYLQVLYAHESVNNANEQLQATTSQLALAEERLKLGAISQSDYLQIKSELASEKLILANAQSTLNIARISLMQLMELPVNDQFDVLSPSLDSLLNVNLSPSAVDVYNTAMGIKPQIQSAMLSTQSAEIDLKIARSGYLPSLTMNASVGGSYSSNVSGFSYTEQYNNRLTPALGLTLSVPIFQKKQVKTSVGIARIGINEAQLNELNTKNQLRKEIEQACADVVSAQLKYQAGLEQYSAAQESYNVATEKFKVGMMNSVDYLFEKTSLINAQSTLLQSKFNLVYGYKILDFYKGIQLTL
jgi:outer membrane protein